ncbi:MAG: YbaB/EbfC family nucleoid-associated protein [Candidatus Omnitrophica bacterium]|nr:YbaB/EbfC family nucleoid-associated protein [Candidatus Omnitrophota bacterium]
MFEQLKNIMEMQKKIKTVKETLENTIITVQSKDSLVSLTMNGAQKLTGIRINRPLTEITVESLERELRDALERAINQTQQLAAQKVKEITGINLPTSF